MTDQRDRLARLLDDAATLNGIDFVEIASKDQRRLNVHFFNRVVIDGSLNGNEPVTISGGETIATVAVRTLQWAKDDEGRPMLELSVDAPGDFSTYTLIVRSTKLDRFHDRVPFSFKALCESNVDCEVPPHVCPTDVDELPAIDYLAKDFLSFRNVLSEFSAVRYPDWRERSEADFGVMFMEALCAIADDLSYLQDRIAAEATLETATQRRSVVRHARLVDYEPRPAICARVVLQFDVTGDHDLPAQVGVAAEGSDGTRIDFETGNGLGDSGTYPVSERWNRAKKLAPYIWDDRETCVEAGSTELWIAGKGHQFVAGQRLVIETAAAVPGDPPLREVVTVTAVEEVVDELFGNDVTHIVWGSQEALKKDHDISLDVSGQSRTTISGNLVPGTQGRLVVDSFFIPGSGVTSDSLAAARTGPRSGDRESLQYLYTLGTAPLAWLMALDGTSFAPEVRVAQVATAGKIAWDWHRHIIDAGAADLAFTIEPFRLRAVARNRDKTISHDYQDDAGETIRFGDGVFGVVPPEGAAFETRYRAGDGARGNVAADSVRRVAAGAPSYIVSVTNPFAAEGGLDEESNDRVRRLAPQAFRAKQFRAVRTEDYAAAAELLPWVSKAGAVFRWTGSWMTVFTTVDPKAGEELSVSRQVELIELLNRYRLAGYESYVLPPRYAPLDLQIEVCASTEAFRGDVEEGVLDALGTTRFFHPDRFTFGTALERSALEAAVQEVPGVSGVLSVLFRRRGVIPSFIALPQALPIARNEILRVDNDPSRPERGSIRVRVKGGK